MNKRTKKKTTSKLRVERKLTPQEKISLVSTILRQDSMVFDVLQDQTMTITVRLRDYADEIQIHVLK